jgi:quercetin dioxygenase-like cupin family protein
MILACDLKETAHRKALRSPRCPSRQTKRTGALHRVKAAASTRLMPHKHPEDCVYTVISGVFYIWFGQTFDGDKMKAYPPGAVIVLPGETWHFHWARSGEYVTQATAIGPLGLEYDDPHDDPRPQSA